MMVATARTSDSAVPHKQAGTTNVHDATLMRAVARAKQGDRDAMRYIYVRYADDVCRYVRSIVRNEHDAEDVTQQVFAKLIRQIGQYEQRQVPFTAWIMRVAHNLTIDHMRRQRAVPVEEVRGAERASDGTRRERARDLTEALAELPEDQREVLVLRHIYGMSPGEIAERTGKSEGSIHGLHHRGRRALKLALEDRGAAPATL
jgi:RNA polymerase sigma-70 factor, ECF subfamily